MEMVPSINLKERNSKLAWKLLPISLGERCHFDKIDDFTFWSFSSNEELESFARLTSLKCSAGLSRRDVLSNSSPTPTAAEEDVFMLNVTTEVIRKEIKTAEFGTTSTPQQENQQIDQGMDQTKSCKTCKKTFLLRSSLDVHRCVNGKTIATKLLYCEFCNHASYRSDTMRMHVRLIHGTRLKKTLLIELFDDLL